MNSEIRDKRLLIWSMEFIVKFKRNKIEAFPLREIPIGNGCFHAARMHASSELKI
jgi:hypothetical protein